MKIFNRLVRIGRPDRRFGGFGNRMTLEIVFFVVNIAFGVHLAEKIMKIVNRLVRIGRPERRFGGFGNRMMLESVCLWPTSHSVSIWLKNF